MGENIFGALFNAYGINENSLPEQSEEDKARIRKDQERRRKEEADRLAEKKKKQTEEKKKLQKEKGDREAECSTQEFVRIIALDESGKFEAVRSKSDFRCIGGVVADIPLKNMEMDDVVLDEKKKIIAFLDRICDEFNSSYLKKSIYAKNNDWRVAVPYSLHGGDISIVTTSGNSISFISPDYDTSGKWLSTTKNTELRKMSRAFLHELCSKTREFVEDHYKFFGYILYSDQIKYADNLSNVVDYKIGSNLYEEMLFSCIENLLFYDVDRNVKKTSIQMANRTLNSSAMKEEEEKAYQKIYESYEKNSSNGVRLYKITNTHFVKTSLMHKINFGNVKNKDINISINSQSIDYNLNSISESKKSDVITDNAFLYLADIVCNILRDDYYYKNVKDIGKDRKIKIEKNLKEAGLVANTILYDKNLYDIRFFSDADRMYREMIEYMDSGNMVGYFSTKYDFNKFPRYFTENSKVSLNIYGYYSEYMVKKLDDTLLQRIREDASFRDDLISRMNEYYAAADGMMGAVANKYEKGMSIAAGILNLIEEIKKLGGKGFRNRSYRDKYIFRFNDILLRGYNHRGDIGITKQIIEKCEECGGAVGIEEYIEHKQRSVQYYFNKCAFDHIINDYNKLAGTTDTEEPLDSIRHFSDIEILKYSMQRLAGGKKGSGYLLAGKIYSTMGQAEAFVHSKEAEHFFDLAIQEMEEDFGNIDITRIYKMHHFIDMGQLENIEKYKKLYVKEAIEYFYGFPEDKHEKMLQKGYFDLEDLKEQFDILLNGMKKNSDFRFPMYLFLKAFRVFYLSETDNIQDYELKKYELVKYMAKAIKNLSMEFDDLIHPWELISKNMYEILRGLDGVKITDSVKKMKKYFFERMISDERIKKEGPTIVAIVLKFKLDYMADYIKDFDDKPEKYISESEIEKISQIESLGKFAGMKPEVIAQQKDEIRRLLSEKLTYMYS